MDKHYNKDSDYNNVKYCTDNKDNKIKDLKLNKNTYYEDIDNGILKNKSLKKDVKFEPNKRSINKNKSSNKLVSMNLLILKKKHSSKSIININNTLNKANLNKSIYSNKKCDKLYNDNMIKSNLSNIFNIKDINFDINYSNKTRNYSKFTINNSNNNNNNNYKNSKYLDLIENINSDKFENSKSN